MLSNIKPRIRLLVPQTKLSVREASHIDFVHEKRHMFVSLETPQPPPPNPPLETSNIVTDILFNSTHI
jgi:hypothetical protein